MIELLKEILARLYDIRGLLTWGGTLMVCVIVFVETGMFVGFFLPGDSLLVTAGVFAGAGKLQLAWLLSLVTLCAIAGDQLGYLIGRKAGPALFRRENSRFFKNRTAKDTCLTTTHSRHGRDINSPTLAVDINLTEANSVCRKT